MAQSDTRIRDLNFFGINLSIAQTIKIVKRMTATIEMITMVFVKLNSDIANLQFFFIH